MGLFIANEVKSLYVGDKAVVEVYLGSEKIWKKENENLICTYNITEPGDTQICSNIGIVQSIIVDGVSMNPVDIYNFEKAGEHTVEFVLGSNELISRMLSGISVKSVVIPNGVTLIGDSIFRNCKSLTNITIPNSTTIINTYAFYNCVSLQEITCLATTQLEIEVNVFRNIPPTGILKVPAGSNTGLESQLPEGWTVEYI